MKLHLGCGKRDFGSDWVHIDDHSAAFKPHMDFDKGTLISLNVEGIKS